MAGQYDNLPPSTPQSPEESFQAVQALAKTTQEAMEKFYALMAVLDQFPPTVFLDANGVQFRALAQTVGGGIPPASSPPLAALQPAGDASSGATPRVTMTTGGFGGTVPTLYGIPLATTASSNVIVLSGYGNWAIYCQCDYTYTGGIVTISDAEIQIAAVGSIPVSTLSPSGGGAGLGELNWLLFTSTATVTAGKASTASSPGVAGSQNFGICLDPSGGTGDALTGPWLV